MFRLKTTVVTPGLNDGWVRDECFDIRWVHHLGVWGDIDQKVWSSAFPASLLSQTGSKSTKGRLVP